MGDLVFISYAREDSAFALKLAQSLREHNIPIWIDQLNIEAGKRWDRAIETALTTCSHFLIILSPDSVASENVGNELLYARDEHKYVLPVLYKPCSLPIHIRSLQYVDFTKQSYSEGLRQILTLFTTIRITANQRTTWTPTEAEKRQIEHEREIEEINANIEKENDRISREREKRRCETRKMSIGCSVAVGLAWIVYSVFLGNNSWLFTTVMTIGLIFVVFTAIDSTSA